MHIAPASSSAYLSVPITIAVAISNVADLGSFEFTLHFSPSLVQVQNVTLGTFLGSTGRPVFQIGPTIDNVAGTANLAAATLLPSPAGPIGSGVLAYVRLMPIKQGNSLLSFDLAQAGAVNGAGISLVVQGGSIAIASLQGDFDGDCDVDILDVQSVAYRYGARPPNPLYDPRYDSDNDGDIDILDVQRVGYKYGTRCSTPTMLGDVESKQSEDVEIAPISLFPSSVSLLLDPANAKGKLGVPMTVEVDVADVTNLGSFEFTLEYDPAAMSVQAVTLGELLGSTGRTVFEIPATIDNGLGTATYSAATLGASPPGASGSGTLARVRLIPLKLGYSTVRFRSAQLSDIAGTQIPIDTTALQSLLGGEAVYLPTTQREAVQAW